MKKVLKLKIRSITPVMLGGHNADYIDSVVRIPSLRGIIRWILRTIIASAAREMKLDEKDAIKKVVPFILGGYVDNIGSLSSRISIQGNLRLKKIDRSYFERYIFSKLTFKITQKRFRINVSFQHQRMELLWMNIDKVNYLTDIKNNIENILHGIANKSGAEVSCSISNGELDIKVKKGKLISPKVKQHLEKNVKDYIEKLFDEISKRVGVIQEGDIQIYTFSRIISYEEKLFAYACILALLLLGIGKGSRRGLGAIEILNITTSDELNDIKRKFDEFREALKDKNTEKISAIFREIVKNAIENAKELIKIIKERYKVNIKEGSRGEIPKIPSFDNTSCIIYIKESKKLWEEICELNNELFMRSGKLGLWLRGIDDSRTQVRYLNHYILGLPRSAKGQPKKCIKLNIHTGRLEPCSQKLGNKTGFIYFVDEEEKKEGRRASPIILSAIDSNFIILSIFKSEDWPDEIYWCSTKRTRPTSKPLKDIYELLLDELNKILKERKFTKIFP